MFDVAGVKARLQQFGYTPLVTDDSMIAYEISKISSTVKRKLNLIVLPEDDMEEVLIDMVCGEFLAVKRSLGEYTPENVTQVVKSIQEGDTNITFDNKSTPDARLDGFIGWLSSGHNGALLTYRRVRW